MDYKEITKKNGKQIVFCNLEDLLKEFYETDSMDEVETKKVGNEYIVHCPFCKAEGHTKHKLYIKDDLTVGNCFVCGRAYVNVSDEIDPRIKLGNFFESWLTRGFEQPFSITKLEDPEWSLEKFIYEFDDYSDIGLDYLIRRHGFMKDLYKILQFKFWDDNVVIPFFDKYGEVFYYQIRFTTGHSKIKYFMPPIKDKPPYIINRNAEPCRHQIIIVEGIFDAIAAMIQCPEYTPVAVLGSSISDYQINYIRDYFGYLTDIKIWMDETKISKRIADKLKQVIDYCPINIIKSYGPDPEEIMVDRLSRGLELQWIKHVEDNVRY